MKMLLKKQFIVIPLIVSLLMSILPMYSTISANASGGGNSHIVPARDMDDSSNNKRYAVGFMYIDIWSNSVGEWTTYKKGQKGVPITNTYSFTFPGRMVKGVSVQLFNDSERDKNYFNASRPNDNYARYADWRGNTTVTPDILTKEGIGTETVTFDVKTIGDLDAFDPYDIIAEEQACTDCSPNVQGLRYYFPVVFTFELNGQFQTSSFTTDGQSLSRVFQTESINMTGGRSYSGNPPKTNTNYEYVGYKKSTTLDPPSGSIISGNPPAFVYDGNYDKYTLFLYYKRSSGSGDPTAGEVNIRHMVRIGPNGIYENRYEDSQAVAPLPYTKSYASEPSYGKILGSSLSYSSYDNSPTSNTTQQVNLTIAQSKAYITFFYEEPPKSFTGDFDVIKPKIAYRETFSLKPKNIILNQCLYVSHKWQIKQGMFTYTSPDQNNYTEETTYPFSKWPSVLGIGSFQVFMILKTSCGEITVGPKPLEINGPSSNKPPILHIGFVDPNGDPTKPLSQAYEGQVLNLVLINNPMIPTPSDPDGDSIQFRGFGFSSADQEFIRSIPSKYGGETMMWEYTNLTMDSLGYFKVEASLADQWGAVTTASTSITVVPPNPVAKIIGPTQVKQNRPLKEPFSSKNSYSPIKGRAIDHTRDEWIGDIRTVYVKPGEIDIKLDVYDTLGLKSLEPAVHQLTVLEDMPPVPRLEFSKPTLRNRLVSFKNTSYSPDGDTIVENKVTYRYDSNNNGTFDDEAMQAITMRGDKTFDFKAPNVGKYQFIVYVKEDYGKDGSKSFILEAINDSPTVSFDITSESISPEPVVPVAMRGNIVANWNNSDFYKDNKTSSWAYNSSNGSLSLLFTSFKRNSLSFGPNPGSTFVFDSGMIPNVDSEFSGAKSLGNGYFAVESGDNQKGYNIYKFENGVFNNLGFRASSRIYGVDYGRGIVYTAENWVWGDGDRGFKWYYMDSFINPAGQPFRYSDFIIVDGTIVFRSWTSNGTILANGIAGKFADFFYTHRYDGYDNYDHQRISVNWDGSSSIQYYDRAPGDVNSFYGEGSKTAPNNKMQYIFNNSRYSDIPSGAYSGVSLWDPDTEQVLSGFNAYNDTSAVQTLDGLWGLTSSDILNMQSNTASRNVMGYDTSNPTSVITWDNIALGYSPLLKKLNSNGSLSSSPGAFGFRGALDNSNHMYFMSGSSLKKADVNTGQLWDLSNGRGLSDDTWITLNDDGSVTAYVTDRGNYGVYSGRTMIFYDPSSSNRKETKSVSTHNQLLGTIKLKNASYNFKLKMNMSTGSAEIFSGFSFAAQDHRNMYRVEMNRKKIQLVKVASGNRTVIQIADYPFTLNQSYSIKVQYLDNKIKVYVDGTPVIDRMDDTFNNGGTFGPFAEIPKTEFYNMSYSDLTTLSSSTILDGVAIVDTDITYTIRNDDTEKDPFINARTSWRYDQLSQKFLDAGDGKSGASIHSGKSYTTPITRLDKVGLYRVTYKTTDDPNSNFLYPRMEFEGYRKESNTYVRNVIVHRKPISDYDLSIASNGTVLWTDRSRDLDRYLNAGHYSTENTGIDYVRTKGILEKKFYYISPSGKFVRSKLVSPDEIGEYTIGLAVKDEYEAWSNYVEKTIYIGSVPQPDEPPHAGFNLSDTVAYRGVPVSIDSIAWDKEDGGRTNLPHDYFIRNLGGGTEIMASQNRERWTKEFSSIGTFRIRQVVEDRLGQTDTVSRNVQIVNRIPTATIYMPSSTDQNRPDELRELRPMFKWSYADGDTDPQSRFQVRIYRYGGSLLHDSGIKSGDSLQYTPSEDLPENINLYIIARVYDGYDWGESAPKYFFIETNRPPVADFDWTPKPVYEGDTVHLKNLSSDPDGDLLNEAWIIEDPSGQVRSYQTTPVLYQAIPGQYKVRLNISDGKAQSTMAKIITVIPLLLEADVEHTVDWKSIHNKAGHETTNNPKEFYAGEKLIVHGYPVPASVTQVTVKLDVIGKSGDKLVTNSVLEPLRINQHYRGELYDERWGDLTSGLDKGLYTLNFEVLYQNGVRKTTDVQIRIIGFAQGVAGVHRKQ
ncbi:hypothetical protein SAMN05444162_1040 [Paenibacillaceae bacterium GAS479]|nr:hypothetical protein SAMN05444162_1040 [Paenibacillaceae bacterium GAS479]